MPLYRHHIQQVLVTGRPVPRERRSRTGHLRCRRGRSRSLDWMSGPPSLGARLPTDRFVYIVVALVVFAGLLALLRFTRTSA